MTAKEREVGPVSQEQEQEKKPFFVYFARAHQSRMGKIDSAEPFLVLAQDALEALRIARVRSRGIKKDRPLGVEEVERGEFAYKAKELLEAGRRLPREVIAFAERNGTAEIGKKI